MNLREPFETTALVNSTRNRHITHFSTKGRAKKRFCRKERFQVKLSAAELKMELLKPAWLCPTGLEPLFSNSDQIKEQSGTFKIEK